MQCHVSPNEPARAVVKTAALYQFTQAVVDDCPALVWISETVGHWLARTWGVFDRVNPASKDMVQQRVPLNVLSPLRNTNYPQLSLRVLLALSSEQKMNPPVDVRSPGIPE